ncbi:hypothetical protein PIB30_065524 [Stylosanthes scabra]|uniref:Uncharacterized protein n=1 Tax=Stylosanthes scabra TaxID=79078 RepID=A0ABU6QMN0_9FABA|nr:hypothetical protein [Stylosanthes scabra]
MYDEHYVSQEVNGGIHVINFPASGNSGLSVVKRVPKEHPCREISAHDDHMETPNYDIEQALGRNVASSGMYMLGVIRDIYWIGRYRCLYHTENPVVWDSHPVSFTFGKQAKQRLWFKMLESLRCVKLCMCIKEN